MERQRPQLTLKDKVIRGAFAVTLLAGAVNIGRDNDPRIEDLSRRINELELQLQQNLVGDCINEGILKSAFGVQPSTLEECKQERIDWTNNLTPTPESPDI